MHEVVTTILNADGWVVLIVNVRDGFDPLRLVAWAQRKGLVTYADVFRVDKGTAERVRCLALECGDSVEPEAPEGDPEDLYELLGF